MERKVKTYIAVVPVDDSYYGNDAEQSTVDKIVEAIHNELAERGFCLIDTRHQGTRDEQELWSTDRNLKVEDRWERLDQEEWDRYEVELWRWWEDYMSGNLELEGEIK